MKHPTANSTRSSDQRDELFARLDSAMRRHGHLMPLSDDQLRVSEMVEETAKELSSSLRDPEYVLKRGQYLLRNPPQLSLGGFSEEPTVVALMEAARNGRSISDDVRRTMGEDRRRAEQGQRPDDACPK